MKIFISHADADRELASEFVELLQVGAGVPHHDIFYSSRDGDIPNGEFFVQRILRELNTSNRIIALLSRQYLKSRFCLAEAGAALARKTAGSASFYSLTVPPLRFRDLDGV